MFKGTVNHFRIHECLNKKMNINDTNIIFNSQFYTL